jgi:hypothetical protein
MLRRKLRDVFETASILTDHVDVFLDACLESCNKHPLLILGSRGGDVIRGFLVVTGNECLVQNQVAALIRDHANGYVVSAKHIPDTRPNTIEQGLDAPSCIALFAVNDETRWVLDLPSMADQLHDSEVEVIEHGQLLVCPVPESLEASSNHVDKLVTVLTSWVLEQS